MSSGELKIKTLWCWNRVTVSGKFMTMPDLSSRRINPFRNSTVPNCQIIPPVIGMESLAATADNTLGKSSSDLFKVETKL